MTIDVRTIRSVLWAIGVVVLAVGCRGQTSMHALAADMLPTSLVEGYAYAEDKARDWSPTAFLEGAEAGYRRQGSEWRLDRLGYVFVDTERYEYIMVILDLNDRVAKIHPPAPIERSLVTTFPFLLRDVPVQEKRALEIAQHELGSTVAQRCTDPEVALGGSGSGEHQYWIATYTAREPYWRVVGELSVDAITGEVFVLDDATDICRR